MLELAGWLGAALVLSAYALLSAQKFRADDYSYHLLNLCGALLLMAYAYFHGAYASIGVNAVWLVIGLAAMMRIAAKRR